MDFSAIDLRILQKKIKKNVLNCFCNLENISQNKRTDLMLNEIKNNKATDRILIRIIFWEDTNFIVKYLKTIDDKFELISEYSGEKQGGLILNQFNDNNFSVLKSILISHFNYELAKKPSLNIRLQICVPCEEFKVLYDIYDDRGFYKYLVQNLEHS